MSIFQMFYLYNRFKGKFPKIATILLKEIITKKKISLIWLIIENNLKIHLEEFRSKIMLEYPKTLKEAKNRLKWKQEGKIDLELQRKIIINWKPKFKKEGINHRKMLSNAGEIMQMESQEEMNN